MDEVKSGKQLACSGHYLSPIAKGEPVTDMADDQEGFQAKDLFCPWPLYTLQ